MVRRKLDERDSINSRLSHSLPNGLHRICDSLIQLVYKSPPPHTHTQESKVRREDSRVSILKENNRSSCWADCGRALKSAQRTAAVASSSSLSSSSSSAKLTCRAIFLFFFSFFVSRKYLLPIQGLHLEFVLPCRLSDRQPTRHWHGGMFDVYHEFYTKISSSWCCRSAARKLGARPSVYRRGNPRRQQRLSRMPNTRQSADPAADLDA